VRSADDDHDVGNAGEFLSGGLALFGGKADGVDETDLGIRKPGSQSLDECLDAIDGLRGLGGDAETITVREGVDLRFGEHDMERFEVLGDTADFHVVVFADDHGVVTFGDEGTDGAVGDVNEGAGGFDQAVTAGGDGGETFLGGAVGGDENGLGGDGIEVLFELDAAAAEVGEDRFVVDEVTENGEGLCVGVAMGEIEGVANAEAHAHVLGAQDTQGRERVHAL